MILRRVGAVALTLLLGASCEAADRFVRTELRIPMAEAGPEGLQTILIYPATPGKHPLAILSHGSPRDAAQRTRMSPNQMIPQAMEFARRGWAAAVVMRRGYGTSGGDWAESWGTCGEPRFKSAGEAGKADLTAAIAYLSALPEVDASRVLAVGVSAGGFATVALAADPPAGLAAAISFAGGRGSSSGDVVCADDALVESFRSFGASAKIPMLWIYAANDHFFGPALARKMLAAFQAGGGRVRFVDPGPFGADGHTLFSGDGIPVWTPIVDSFLASRHLKILDAPLAVPPPLDLPAPKALSASGLDAWKKYLAAPPHKAFAVSPRGRYGWRTSRADAEEARAAAMENCAAPGCAIVAVDDAPAGP